MNTIKLLNSMEVGMPLIITTNWQDITTRKVSLYGGTKGDGVYNFIDDTGSYKCTEKYIKDHITIQTTLTEDEDLFTLVKLIKKVKEKEVK